MLSIATLVLEGIVAPSWMASINAAADVLWGSSHRVRGTAAGAGSSSKVEL